MNENTDEVLIDLLIKKATYGLTEAEQVQLDMLENGRHDNSFDLTVSAITLIGQTADEQMPSHLRANVRVAAETYFDERETAENPPTVRTLAGSERTRPSILSWLGWAVAAVACVALAANIYFTRVEPPPIVKGPTATPTEEKPTLAQERQRLMGSAGDLVKASLTNGPMKEMPPTSWTVEPMKEMPDISGDIVWSDSMQRGYMRLRGLPMNDKSKQQYQLWIFDESQSKKTPIDGGVFDVNENGEVILPVNAKLKARKPYQFAITIEKPGGVVVSDDKYIAALGKVET
jgi:anti-sigma-K factor RskA